MTSSSRRAFPWLVSIGAHCAALLIVGVLLASTPGLALSPPVEITLAGAPGSGRGGPVTDSPLARAGAAPRSTGAPKKGVAPRSAGVPEAPAPLPLNARAPAPAAEETTPGVPDVPGDTASAVPASEPLDAGGSPSGTMVGWVGIQRRLIHKPVPDFPAILSAIGQEIEGEAMISVAPSGIVTRVEITRSSGYIEFDASVEAALRDYLYSRVDGRTDTVGTVQFRFRLEKKD
jgi:TonB family protein